MTYVDISLGQQVARLLLLALPVACMAWTLTHEEIFAEVKNYCVKCSKEGKTLIKRKFFYLFTCEYCTSHYLVILMLLITGYHLIFADWRGYLIGGFSMVWIANIYMNLYNLIRIDIKKEKTEIEIKEIEKRKHEKS